MAWIEYNPNPNGIRVGDCAVRAVAKAFGDKWDKAFARIALEGFILGDMPSSDAVWGNVLMRNGFRRKAIISDCQDCYTAEDFCRDHPEGTYVLAFGGHVATVVDGDLFDSWNSMKEIPIYYYELLRIGGVNHGLEQLFPDGLPAHVLSAGAGTARSAERTAVADGTAADREQRPDVGAG